MTFSLTNRNAANISQTRSSSMDWLLCYLLIIQIICNTVDSLQVPRPAKISFSQSHNQLNSIRNSQNRRSFLTSSSYYTTSAIVPSFIMSTANTATSAEGQNRPLNVALLGAGIFASTSHAPILKNNPDTFNCVAVWSRRIESASTLVSTTLQQSKAYSDLDEVLNLPNLDAVIMALPIDVQPEYVVKCLKANKHVLSEKPIAATVEEANKVLQVYTKDYSHLKWSVAENFRYEPAVLRAADIIQNKKDVSIGEPFLVSLTIRAPFLPTNKYLNTAWRKEPSWYGGLFIDAFVHASAMLRVMFGDAKSVSAITSSKSDYIPGVDTMSANVSWDNDLHGDISVTYFCKQMKFELEVMGSEGSMIFARKTDGPGYHLKVLKNDGECIEEDFGFGGLEGEFFAFAAACKNEGSDQNTPSEARKDLAFVEACLLSGKSNGEKTNVEV